MLQDIYYRFQQQVPVACPPVLVTTTKRLLGRAAPPAKNRQPCLHPLLCLVQRSPSLATSAALAFRLLLRRANPSHLRALALAIPSALHVLLPDPPSDLGSNATSSGSPSLISPSNTCPLSHVTLPCCHITIRSYLLCCGRMHCLSIKKTSSREQTLSFSFSGETSTLRPVPGS